MIRFKETLAILLLCMRIAQRDVAFLEQKLEAAERSAREVREKEWKPSLRHRRDDGDDPQIPALATKEEGRNIQAEGRGPDEKSE